MQPEKTVKMNLTQKDLKNLRMNTKICIVICCKKLFFTDDEDQVVCDECVKEAMEAEGFNLK